MRWSTRWLFTARGISRPPTLTISYGERKELPQGEQDAEDDGAVAEALEAHSESDDDTKTAV